MHIMLYRHLQRRGDRSYLQIRWFSLQSFYFHNNSITGTFKFNIDDIVGRPSHSSLNTILFEEKSKIEA
jgi:hypothetical protein